VSGPTGTTLPSNVDDYYSPEVNSSPVNLPGIKTASGVDCTTANLNSGDWTGDFDNIKCYDQLKVNAVLNWIDGKTHLGTGTAPAVPEIFGMNFQAVSVGQKLIENGVKGGYMDAAGTPTPSMLGEFKFVDGAIGQFVSGLKKNHLLDSTTIIITAKHGQSPIDTHRFFPIPGPSGANGTPPSGILGSAFLPDSELNQVGPTEDDVSLLWLKPGVSTTDAVALLEQNASAAAIGQILYGPSLETVFDAPGLPSAGGDPRTPDIIVMPNVGVVYTGSKKKQSEHGGFAFDDTNVILLVSNPSIQARTVTTFVETTQVAPTVLKILGLDPDKLDAVRKEGTAVLPGFGGESDNQE
jgi:Type I phosphodiesterase / nucleotide pyrophosphatase